MLFRSSYKDYRRSGSSRIMRLAPHEFIRRFLLHVLPDGFHRIRHYGFLAKGERGEKLAYVRDLLQVQRAQEPDDEAQATPKPEPEADPSHEPFAVCPDCGGLMRCMARASASPGLRRRAPGPVGLGAGLAHMRAFRRARPEPPKRSPPNVQNVLRSPAAAFATHALAFKIKPTLRFPHTS